MGNYLAFVVVYNLLPDDLSDDLFLERLESTINDAMTSMRRAGFAANDTNMIFSFPQDPSVKSSSIPVVADITLFSTANFKPGFIRHKAVSGIIRESLASLFRYINLIKRRENVIVIVRQPGRLVSY